MSSVDRSARLQTISARRVVGDPTLDIVLPTLTDTVTMSSANHKRQVEMYVPDNTDVLVVDGSSIINNDLTVLGTLIGSGNSHFIGEMVVDGNLVARNLQLPLNAAAYIPGNSTFGKMDVTDDATFRGDANFLKNLEIQGDTSTLGATNLAVLDVSGAANFGDDITVQGNLTVNGFTRANGGASVMGGLTINGGANIASGASTVAGSLVVNGTFAANGGSTTLGGASIDTGNLLVKMGDVNVSKGIVAADEAAVLNVTLPGGAIRSQVESVPGALFVAPLRYNAMATECSVATTSRVGIIGPDAYFNAGKLSPVPASSRIGFARWSNAPDFGNTGCVRFKYTPFYTNGPTNVGDKVPIFALCPDTVGEMKSAIYIYHEKKVDALNYIVCLIYDGAGTLLQPPGFDVVWNAVLNQEYEFMVNFDMAKPDPDLTICVDGVAIHAPFVVRPEASPRGVLVSNKLIVSGNFTDTGISNAGFRDFIVYSAIQAIAPGQIPLLAINLSIEQNTSFNVPPVCPVSATNANELVNKGYVDGVVATGIAWLSPVDDCIAVALMLEHIIGRYINTQNGSSAGFHPIDETYGSVDANNIYEFDGEHWTFTVATAGMTVYVKGGTNAGSNLTFNGLSWVSMGGAQQHQSLVGSGTLTHAQIDGYLDQSVKQNAAPTFDGANIVGTMIVGQMGTPNLGVLNISSDGTFLVTSNPYMPDRFTAVPKIESWERHLVNDVVLADNVFMTTAEKSGPHGNLNVSAIENIADAVFVAPMRQNLAVLQTLNDNNNVPTSRVGIYSNSMPTFDDYKVDCETFGSIKWNNPPYFGSNGWSVRLRYTPNYTEYPPGLSMIFGFGSSVLGNNANLLTMNHLPSGEIGIRMHAANGTSMICDSFGNDASILTGWAPTQGTEYAFALDYQVSAPGNPNFLHLRISPDPAPAGFVSGTLYTYQYVYSRPDVLVVGGHPSDVTMLCYGKIRDVMAFNVLKSASYFPSYTGGVVVMPGGCGVTSDQFVVRDAANSNSSISLTYSGDHGGSLYVAGNIIASRIYAATQNTSTDFRSILVGGGGDNVSVLGIMPDGNLTITGAYNDGNVGVTMRIPLQFDFVAPFVDQAPGAAENIDRFTGVPTSEMQAAMLSFDPVYYVMPFIGANMSVTWNGIWENNPSYFCVHMKLGLVAPDPTLNDRIIFSCTSPYSRNKIEVRVKPSNVSLPFIPNSLTFRLYDQNGVLKANNEATLYDKNGAAYDPHDYYSDYPFVTYDTNYDGTEDVHFDIDTANGRFIANKAHPPHVGDYWMCTFSPCTRTSATSFTLGGAYSNMRCRDIVVRSGAEPVGTDPEVGLYTRYVNAVQLRSNRAIFDNAQTPNSPTAGDDLVNLRYLNAHINHSVVYTNDVDTATWRRRSDISTVCYPTADYHLRIKIRKMGQLCGLWVFDGNPPLVRDQVIYTAGTVPYPPINDPKILEGFVLCLNYRLPEALRPIETFVHHCVYFSVDLTATFTMAIFNGASAGFSAGLTSNLEWLDYADGIFKTAVESISGLPEGYKQNGKLFIRKDGYIVLAPDDESSVAFTYGTRFVTFPAVSNLLWMTAQ